VPQHLSAMRLDSKPIRINLIGTKQDQDSFQQQTSRHRIDDSLSLQGIWFLYLQFSSVFKPTMTDQPTQRN